MCKPAVLTFLAFLSLLIISCNDDSPQSNDQKQVTSLQSQVRELKQERDKLEELCDTTIKRLESLEAKRARAEAAELQRIEADRIEIEALHLKRLAEIKQRQLDLWASYTNKTYPIFTLRSGRTYDNVIVSNINTTGFGIIHQSGTARIPFSSLERPLHRKLITNTEREIKQLKLNTQAETNLRQAIRQRAKAQAKDVSE